MERFHTTEHTSTRTTWQSRVANTGKDLDLVISLHYLPSGSAFAILHFVPAGGGIESRNPQLQISHELSSNEFTHFVSPMEKDTSFYRALTEIFPGLERHLHGKFLAEVFQNQRRKHVSEPLGEESGLVKVFKEKMGPVFSSASLKGEERKEVLDRWEKMKEAIAGRYGS